MSRLIVSKYLLTRRAKAIATEKCGVDEKKALAKRLRARKEETNAWTVLSPDLRRVRYVMLARNRIFEMTETISTAGGIPELRNLGMSLRPLAKLSTRTWQAFRRYERMFHFSPILESKVKISPDVKESRKSESSTSTTRLR
jgi:hypothetical protein